MIPQSPKSSHHSQLLERLRSRQAHIGIVGLGYVPSFVSNLCRSGL